MFYVDFAGIQSLVFVLHKACGFDYLRSFPRLSEGYNLCIVLHQDSCLALFVFGIYFHSNWGLFIGVYVLPFEPVFFGV